MALKTIKTGPRPPVVRQTGSRVPEEPTAYRFILQTEAQVPREARLSRTRLCGGTGEQGRQSALFCILKNSLWPKTVHRHIYLFIYCLFKTNTSQYRQP